MNADEPPPGEALVEEYLRALDRNDSDEATRVQTQFTQATGTETDDFLSLVFLRLMFKALKSSRDGALAFVLRDAYRPLLTSVHLGRVLSTVHHYLEADARDAAIHLLRGIASAVGADDVEALGLLMEVRLLPEKTREQKFGELQAVHERLRATAAWPELTATVAVDLGTLSMMRQDASGAAQFFEEALVLLPSDPKRMIALSNLLIVYKRLERDDDRVRIASELAALDPTVETNRKYITEGLLARVDVERGRGNHNVVAAVLGPAIGAAVIRREWDLAGRLLRELVAYGAVRTLMPAPRRGGEQRALPDELESTITDLLTDAGTSYAEFGLELLPDTDLADWRAAARELRRRAEEELDAGRALTARLYATISRAWAMTNELPDLIGEAAAIEAEACFTVGDLYGSLRVSAEAIAAFHSAGARAAGPNVDSIKSSHPLAREIVRQHTNAGLLHSFAGDVGSAVFQLTGIVEHYVDKGPAKDLRLCLMALGDAELRHRFVSTASANYRRAFDSAAADGDTEDEELTATWLAAALEAAGQHEEEADALEAAIAAALQNSHEAALPELRARLTTAVYQVAVMQALRKEFDAAAKSFDRLLPMLEETGAPPKTIAFARFQRAFTFLQRDAWEEGIAATEKAVEALIRADIGKAIFVLEEVGKFAHHHGQPQQSRQWLERAVALAAEHDLESDAPAIIRDFASPPKEEPPLRPDESAIRLLQRIIDSKSDEQAAEVVRSEITTVTPSMVEMMFSTDLGQSASVRILRALLAVRPPSFERPQLAGVHLELARELQRRSDWSGARQEYQNGMDLVAGSDDEWSRMLEAELIGGLGALASNTGNWRESASRFDAAIGIRRAQNNAPRLAAALGNAGLAYLFLGEYDLARKRYEEALKLRMEQNNIHGAITALHNLARIDFQLGDAAHASSRLVAARNLTAVNPQERMETLSSEAEVLRELGRDEEARGALAELEKTARAEGARERLVGALCDHVTLELRIGHNAEALALAREAERESTESGRANDIVRAKTKVAEALSATGERGAAIETLESALDIARPVRSSSLLFSIASAFHDLTGPDPAYDITSEAYDLARTAGDPGAMIDAKTRAGWISWYGGELERALGDFEVAKAIEEQVSGRVSSNIMEGLGLALRDLGDHSTALKMLAESASRDNRRESSTTRAHRAFQKLALHDAQTAQAEANAAVGLAIASGDRSQLAFAYHAVASVLLSEGYTTTAVVRAQQAVEILLDELHDELNGVQPLVALADGLGAMGKVDEATATYQRAIEICQRYSFRQFEATAWNNLGVMQQHQGLLDDALRSFESAKSVAARARLAGLESNAESLIAAALYARGDFEDAHRHAMASVDLVERLRAASNRGEQEALRGEISDRAQIAAFTAAALGKDVDAWHLAERARSRLLAEDLGGHTATFERTKQILATFKERVVLVSYLDSEAEGILASVITAKSTKPLMIHLPNNIDIAMTVERAVSELRKGSDPISNEALTALSKHLVRPLCDAIVGADVLLICPRGALWSVPFPLLSMNGKLLSSAFTLAFLPNAAVLGGPPATIDPAHMLVIGDPLGDLEGARDEAAEIAQQLGVEPLLLSEATRERFRERSTESSGLHFAGHGFFFDDAPERSGLRLADGRLPIASLARWNVKLPLCVLTACDSGRVGQVGGGEVVGLSTAMLLLGARSVIAAQWAVADDVSRSFTRILYECLLAGHSLGLAVAYAIREITSTFGYGYAPFILIGDWRTSFQGATSGGRESATHPNQ